MWISFGLSVLCLCILIVTCYQGAENIALDSNHLSQDFGHISLKDNVLVWIGGTSGFFLSLALVLLMFPNRSQIKLQALPQPEYVILQNPMDGKYLAYLNDFPYFTSDRNKAARIGKALIAAECNKNKEQLIAVPADGFAN